jgi:MYXO-CTERM domain-containing protein
MWNSRTAIASSLVLACLIGSAQAADHLMTVSGPFHSFNNESYAFDGVNNTELPPLYNIPALTGGTFRATYRFSDTPNPPNGTFASYSFGALSGMTYDLLDAGGNVIHHGSSPSFSGASVQNNGVQPNGTFDSVSLYGFVNQVTGLNLPAAIYTPPGELDAVQSSIGFNGMVTPGTDFITDLGVPTSEGVYRSFTSAKFFTGMLFQDGDTLNFVDPYQYVETDVIYDITSVFVTPVPAPGAAGVLALGGLLVTRRRRR